MASPPVEGAFDTEIASLQDELATLRKTLRIECSTILSSPTFHVRKPKHHHKPSAFSSSRHPLKSKSAAAAASKPRPKPAASPSGSGSPSSSPSSSSSSSPTSTAAPASDMASLSALQAAHAQQCLYRIATAVTAFKVRDPDPHAVDAGRVLALRFEAMARGAFLAPYYVMLTRPVPGSPSLRVHRHTVPPAVPLPGLAARFLPAAPGAPQDLDAFVRALRREIARHHNRLGAAADVRRALGTSADVAVADVEAKHLRISWDDERHARLVMDDDGALTKAVVLDARGRDWDTAQRVFGDCAHVNDLVKMLDGDGS